MSVSAPLAAIRAQHPLLHCISNIVSANDCANLALAIGASPIMAQAPQEMADIAALASAVVLNTGTPDEAKFAAARTAGATANRRSIPVVLDPVGVGASPWRLANIQSLFAAGAARHCASERRGGRRPAGPWRQRARGGQSDRPQSARRAGRSVGAKAGVCGAAFRHRGSDCRWAAALHRARRQRPDAHRDGGRVYAFRFVRGVCRRTAGDAFTAAVQAARFWKACAEQAEDHAAGAGSFRVALFDAAGSMTDEVFAGE